MKKSLFLMLYQARLKRKAEASFRCSLFCADFAIDKSHFDEALGLINEAGGKYFLANTLDIISHDDAVVWKNAVESRRKFVNDAKRMEYGHFPKEKDGEFA